MRFPAACALLMLFALRVDPAHAQVPAEWHDDLVDHMAGAWTLTGPVMGHDAHHDLQAEWALNHQFLRIHEKTTASAPASERRYQATWYLGYDAVSERYVLHLLDVFGGRYSESLGYGTRDGNAIRFVFEYPDGPSTPPTAGRPTPAPGNGCWSKRTRTANGPSSPISNSHGPRRNSDRARCFGRYTRLFLMLLKPTAKSQ